MGSAGVEGGIPVLRRESGVRRLLAWTAAVCRVGGVFAQPGPRYPPNARDEVRTAEGKRIRFTERLGSPPPRIDGMLDDPAWEEGYWSRGYR